MFLRNSALHFLPVWVLALLLLLSVYSQIHSLKHRGTATLKSKNPLSVCNTPSTHTPRFFQCPFPLRCADVLWAGKAQSHLLSSRYCCRSKDKCSSPSSALPALVLPAMLQQVLGIALTTLPHPVNSFSP